VADQVVKASTQLVMSKEAGKEFLLPSHISDSAEMTALLAEVGRTEQLQLFQSRAVIQIMM
jgi:hypothetical protein